jgi:hypothetical protein
MSGRAAPGCGAIAAALLLGACSAPTKVAYTCSEYRSATIGTGAAVKSHVMQGYIVDSTTGSVARWDVAHGGITPACNGFADCEIGVTAGAVTIDALDGARSYSLSIDRPSGKLLMSSVDVTPAGLDTRKAIGGCVVTSLPAGA